MRAKVLLMTAGLLAGSVTAFAHHSFPATYQISKIITIEGKVAQFLLRNPHSFIQVDAPDEAGKLQRWSLEWGGAAQLLSQGVLRDSLKAGDSLVITANPARSSEDSTRALLKTIKRSSDGWSWGFASGQVVD